MELETRAGKYRDYEYEFNPSNREYDVFNSTGEYVLTTKQFPYLLGWIDRDIKAKGREEFVL